MLLGGGAATIGAQVSKGFTSIADYGGFCRPPQSIQVAAQLLAQVRVAQLAKRHRLDLADALARNAKLGPDLLQRAVAPVVEAVAKLDHLAFALGQLLQYFLDLLAQYAGGRCVNHWRDA